MRFKMAPNSLFAVLLRSPWWISMVLACVLAAVAFSLLPEKYRLLGAMGGLPFIVIGFVALWRQMQLPSAKRSDEILAAVRTMNWTEFALLLEEGFARQGYRVERLQGPVDFALTRAGGTTLVAAKRWKAARVGEELLQSLHAAAQAQDASHCLYVTLGELSPNAQSFARRYGVQLMQAPAVALLLKKSGIRSR